MKILHPSWASLKNFIDGKFVEFDSNSNKPIENYSPATGEVIGYLPRSQAREVEQAFQSAKKAFYSFSETSRESRSQLLHRIADRILENIDRLAEIESLDQGKPVHLAKNMDMQRCIENFRFFADLILQEKTEIYTKENFESEVIRKPVGVVGLISPWNLPLYLLTWKIAPAMAAGNTLICKPSEFTSLSALFLADITKDLIPPGVLNIVIGLGPEVGEAIVQHPQIQAISFTGGTATGQRIFEQSAKNFKKISLELGGKNPNIIFADADFEKALSGTIRSSFLNQGEICLCGSRIYVEKKIADSFIPAFVEEARRLIVGDPKNPNTFMGALISQAHLNKVKSYVEMAQQEGGVILTGGETPQDLPIECKNGYFLRPTVITGLSDQSRCIQEEIFGPVVTISIFDTEEEVIERANNVKYGLSATVWTKDSSRARRLAERLDAGTVWLNCWLKRDLRVPFGGMKHSGIGREGGWHSIEFFTEPTVFVREK
jgi:acyl-CoA reductase-like NAD-dependent aldehyde dehydrogenase